MLFVLLLTLGQVWNVVAKSVQSLGRKHSWYRCGGCCIRSAEQEESGSLEGMRFNKLTTGRKQTLVYQNGPSQVQLELKRSPHQQHTSPDPWKACYEWHSPRSKYLSHGSFIIQNLLLPSLKQDRGAKTPGDDFFNWLQKYTHILLTVRKHYSSNEKQ